MAEEFKFSIEKIDQLFYKIRYEESKNDKTGANTDDQMVRWISNYLLKEAKEDLKNMEE